MPTASIHTSEPILIRQACAQDLSGLAALYAQLRPHDPALIGTSYAHLIEQLAANPHAYLFVAQVNHVQVSTCTLALVPNLAHGGKPFGIIEHVVTLSSYRQQDYARAILAHALRHAWSQDCYKVMLLSGATLNAAHSVYESLGFHGDIERGFVVKPHTFTEV